MPKKNHLDLYALITNKVDFPNFHKEKIAEDLDENDDDDEKGNKCGKKIKIINLKRQQKKTGRKLLNQAFK